MKKIILFNIIFALSFCTVSAQSQQEANKDTLRLLFIGNSYTYYNDLPGIVAEIVGVNCNSVVQTKMFAEDGCSLRDHWENPKVLKSIGNGKWHYVILQERTGNVLSRRKEFQGYLKNFADAIKKAKSKPLLYLTSTAKIRLKLQDKINIETKRVAKKYCIPIVPAGIAFKQAHEKRPELGFYNRDQIHPSEVGSYLIANVFYVALLKRPAVWQPPIADSFDLDRKDDDFIRKISGSAQLWVVYN